jgi:WD40 repeat protein
MVRTSLCGGVLILALLPSAVAQAPVNAPALPPINPAAAKLDQTINGLDGPGWALACNEDAGVLAVACEKGTIQVWNKDVLLSIRPGNHTSNVLKGHEGPLTSMAWGNSPVLASAGADRKLLLWSMAEGKVLHSLTTEGIVRALALSPEGKILAGAGDDPTIQFWDIASGKPGLKLKEHTDWVLSLAFSPDGKLLASGGVDGSVRLWEVATGKKLRDCVTRPPPAPNTRPDPPAPILALAFSPDGKLLAVGTSDGQLHLDNVADGKIARSVVGHTGAITSLAFHPSGTVLASGCKDHAVRLWNPANAQLLKALEGHTAWVQGVAFLAHGTRLASVGADQTVRLWELAPK